MNKFYLKKHTLYQWSLISEKGFTIGGPVYWGSCFDAMKWAEAFASSWPSASVVFSDPVNTLEYEKGIKNQK